MNDCRSCNCLFLVHLLRNMFIRSATPSVSAMSEFVTEFRGAAPRWFKRIRYSGYNSCSDTRGPGAGTPTPGTLRERPRLNNCQNILKTRLKFLITSKIDFYTKKNWPWPSLYFFRGGRGAKKMFANSQKKDYFRGWPGEGHINYLICCPPPLKKILYPLSQAPNLINCKARNLHFFLVYKFSIRVSQKT